MKVPMFGNKRLPRIACLLLVGVYSIMILATALVPSQKASAYVAPNELAVEHQILRPFLYALDGCSKSSALGAIGYFKGKLSADDINQYKLTNATDKVAVGFEDEPSDGFISCGNTEGAKLVQYALAYLNIQSQADYQTKFVNKFYKHTGGDNWELQVSSGSVVNWFIEQSKQYDFSANSILGPNERTRRGLIALAQCVMPAGSGAQSGDAVTISGKQYWYRPSKNSGSTIPAGWDWLRNDGNISCGTLVSDANSSNWITDPAVLNRVHDDPTALLQDAKVTPLNSNAGAGSTGGVNFDCNVVFTNPLTWIVCPMTELFQGFINFLDQQINQFLTIPTDYFSSSSARGSDFYKAWASMRTIALALLVIVGLVMVISQAIGIGPFDAYTVKKIMPRIAIAVIGISLSWVLMQFFVSITNDVGNATRGIILSPFRDLQQPSLSGATSSALAGAFGAGLFALGILGMLSFLATAALALLVAMGVLLVREIVVALLAILAPIAIIAYVLPNTERVWKLWWESFSKALLMFPLISAFIAAGRVFAMVSVTSDQQGPPGKAGVDATHQIIAFIATIIPYFLLPATFRLAGGALSTIGNFANDRGRGAFDRLKQFRRTEATKAWERKKEGNLFRGGTRENWRGKIGRAVQAGTLASAGGYDPTKWRSRIKGALADSDRIRSAKYAEENEIFGGFKYDDDKLHAAKFTTAAEIGRELERRAPGRFAGARNARSREDAVNQIMRAQRDIGSDAFQKARVRAQATTGTGYQYRDKDSGAIMFDAAAVLDDINDAYGTDESGAGAALAEIRTSLTQSGQMAGVAGYATWAAQLRRVRDRPGDAGIHESANDVIMEDASRSASAGQAIYGKPSSAAAFAKAHRKRIQGIAEGIMNQRVNPETGAQYSMDDLSAAVAGAAGLYDAMSSASPNSANSFANELFSQSSGIPEIKLPDGTTLMKGQTIGDFVRAQMGGNSEFVNRRKDYGRSTLEEAQAEYAQRNRPVPGANGGGFKPPGPPEPPG